MLNVYIVQNGMAVAKHLMTLFHSQDLTFARTEVITQQLHIGTYKYFPRSIEVFRHGSHSV